MGLIPAIIPFCITDDRTNSKGFFYVNLHLELLENLPVHITMNLANVRITHLQCVTHHNSLE